MNSIFKRRETLTPFAIVPIGYPKKVNEQEDRFDPERVHFIK